MRLAHLVAALVGLLGCFDVPQVTFEVPVEDGSGGTGGGGSAAAAGGGGFGGEGALPVCTAEVSSPCATIEHIWAGGTFSCAGLDDDTVRCFGNDDSGQLGNPDDRSSLFATDVVVRGVSASADIALGHKHGCAIEAGELKCWGRNTLGQLGTGDLVFSDEPVENLVPASVDGVSTYHSATCAHKSGSVLCWGHDINGQGWTEDDFGERQLSPALVSGLGL